jgi:hypothetical protein
MSPKVATPCTNLTVYIHQEEHALLLFSVLEETVISEEKSISLFIFIKPHFYFKIR